MNKNKIKEKLNNNEPVIGIFQSFDSPELIELFGITGYDFLVLDTEHGTLSPGGSEHLIRAIQYANLTPFIRIPNFERSSVLKALDRGAMGILVPMVESKEDAEKIVSLAKYYPMGTRGLALSTRVANYGINIDPKKQIEMSNSETLVIIQIETEEAVKNLDEILQVEGVDMIFVGPSDLAQSLGYPGQNSNPEVQETINNIIEKSVKAGKYVGIFEGNVDATKKWIEKGVNFIACGAPAIIAKGMKSHIDSLGDQFK